MFVTDCTAGWSIQGFVLALYLPSQPGGAQGKGVPVLSQPVPGDPCSTPAEEERGQVKRKGDGKGGCRHRARGVLRAAIPPLAPRLLGRGPPAEPAPHG